MYVQHNYTHTGRRIFESKGGGCQILWGATLAWWADVLWVVGTVGREIGGQMPRWFCLGVSPFQRIRARVENARGTMNRGKPSSLPFYSFFLSFSPVFRCSQGVVVLLVQLFEVAISRMGSNLNLTFLGRSWISLSFVGLNISFGILRWLARQHNANHGGFFVLGQECRPSMATSVLFISTHPTDSWFDSPLCSALWDPVTTLRLVSFDTDMGSPCCLRAADDKVSTKNAAFAWIVDYFLGQS